MGSPFIESTYPLTFRSAEAKKLGEHLRLRHSVEIIGMKRVGISNFLRFFLYHNDVVKTYINHGEKHLFIPVDLNDLIVLELFPFWILAFKRLVDQVEKSEMRPSSKQEIAKLFDKSIQSRDIFITIENLRTALITITQEDYIPTLFLLRFDRIKDIINTEFFANLQGLRDATAQKLAYVFTSFRTLDHIASHVFSRKALSVFSHVMYIKPANEEDENIIFDTFEKHYSITPSEQTLQTILHLTSGHVQYLQLALIILNEKLKETQLVDPEALIMNDERIMLQSEEIWESLNNYEQDTLQKVLKKQEITSEIKTFAHYLWDTGIVSEHDGQSFIPNPLLEKYLENYKTKEKEEAIEFTKKENLLYTLLFDNLGSVCEREKIISGVWPEYEEYGVSDWTIDRLVARLRSKLRLQKSKYEIVTVKTRGYKLVEEQA